MGKSFAIVSIDDELAQQVKDLEKKLDLNFQGLLILLLQRFFEYEELKQKEVREL